MMHKKLFALAVAIFGFLPGHALSVELPISQVPLFAGERVTPVVMLNMSVDSQLFASAFPEYADLGGKTEDGLAVPDGLPDRGYIHGVDYFGYFDAFKCYSYSDTNGRFVPESTTEDKKCSGSTWSGNFLNWVTMARIDNVRQILYGGKRSTDTDSLTVLERTYLPTDSHSWVKYFDERDVDGANLNDLTPFSDQSMESIGTSNSTVDWTEQGDRTFDVTSWAGDGVQVGDQLEVVPLDTNDDPLTWQDDDDETENFMMLGVVDSRTSAGTITVRVTSSHGDVDIGDHSNWEITNKSRAGITFCNTTDATGPSHGNNAINAPPLMKIAKGDYRLWSANERWQCQWSDEKNAENGNDVSASGLYSNDRNPVRSEVAADDDHIVRVEVCKKGLVHEESCNAYGPSGPSNVLKPIGLLQEFGEDGQIHFGLMTGTFTNHVDGGALRKNMGTFRDEVSTTDGTFLNPTDSIVRSLDALRLFGYDHDGGTYTDDDSCTFETTKTTMVGGKCFSWGNPQAEIYAESLRYLAGLEANSDFTHSGDDRIPGLTSADWDNPVTDAEWCTQQTVIQFNASVTSFDNQAGAAASDLPAIGSVDTWTNRVGTGEGISGDVFVGIGGDDDNGLCTAKSGSLADFRGICPEAPNQDGTFAISGLAHYAYVSDLRPTWRDDQTVKTIGVSLAPALPRITIPRSDLQILPACENKREDSRCQLTDFQIISLESEDDIERGSFFIQWDVAEWGADRDSDINGTLSYEYNEATDEVKITTQTWAESTGRASGFGYIISGTDSDGFHAHSGVEGYDRVNTGSPNCNNCEVNDPPTTAEFTVGTSSATLLPDPLLLAAKWGGYDKDLAFPANQDSWDRTGGVDGGSDGLPDNYFFSINPAQLAASLRAAFQQVLDAVDTTTLETTSSRLETGTLVYQAGFDTKDWTGDVLAIDPLETGSGRLKWDAAEKLNARTAASRQILVPSASDPPALVDFDQTNIGTELMAGVNVLVAAGDCSGLDKGKWFCELDEEMLVNFLRGNNAQSISEDGALRDRQSPIGDIVNSQIVLYPTPARLDEGWSFISDTYQAFVDDKAERLDPDTSGDPTVFVGSNNGMLHAFNAITGEERFAFVPRAMLADMHKLANPDYQHQFFVDGRIAVADAFFGGEWRTVLVGSYGAGAKGLFALDVTDPDSPKILWEVGPDSTGAENLGHIFSTPTISRLENGTFVTIVGNGVNGEIIDNGDNTTSNIPSLMVLSLEDGTVLDDAAANAVDSNAGLPNGLSGPALVLDLGTRSFVTRAYAGDLQGRLWAFDFSQADIVVESSERVVFEAVIPVSGPNPDLRQSITSAPNVTIAAEGGYSLYFGTGRFVAVGDSLTTSPVQSFYRVRDTGTTLTRADLGETEITGSSTDGRSIRVSTPDADGWYLDLVNVDGSGTSELGERVLSRPEVFAGRVIFSTYQPSGDACDGGGIPRLYVLNSADGAGALGIDDCPECGGVTIADVGSPLNPPVVIAPPTPVDDVDNPLPELDEDGNPIPQPIPPDGDGLDRSSWCSRVGYLNPVNQVFVPLAALCDGRQIWRQPL